MQLQEDEENLPSMTPTEIATTGCNSRTRRMRPDKMIGMQATIIRTQNLKYIGINDNTHNVECFKKYKTKGKIS